MEVPKDSYIVNVPTQNYKEIPVGRSKLNIQTGCKHKYITWGAVINAISLRQDKS